MLLNIYRIRYYTLTTDAGNQPHGSEQTVAMIAAADEETARASLLTYLALPEGTSFEAVSFREEIHGVIYVA